MAFGSPSFAILLPRPVDECSKIYYVIQHEDQVRRRKLWSELDRLKEQLYPLGNEAPIQMSEVKELESRLSLGEVRPLSLMAIVRAFAMVCWVFLSFPWMIAFAPLRLLYPILRCFGLNTNFLPLDWIIYAFCHIVMTIGGIQVHVEGYEHAKKLQRSRSGTLVFYNHCSNLDVFIIQGYCPLSLKWIGKQSLYLVPLLGWFAFLYGVLVGIDRSNHEKAVATLKKARNTMHKYGRTVAIAPEGTRSPTGQLVSFKKGPFHLALEVQVPILPVIIYGAAELWPKDQFFSHTGTLNLRYLEPIPYEDYAHLDYNELLKKVRKDMLAASEEYPTVNGPSRSIALWFRLLHNLSLVLVPLALYYQTQWFFAFVSALI